MSPMCLNYYRTCVHINTVPYFAGKCVEVMGSHSSFLSCENLPNALDLSVIKRLYSNKAQTIMNKLDKICL